MKHTCKNCKVDFIRSVKIAKFCSSKCAAVWNNSKRIVSESQKEKTKNSMTRYYSQFENTGKGIEKLCVSCNTSFVTSPKYKIKKYCSLECMYKTEKYKNDRRQAGLKSAAVRVKRSKNEIKLFDLCLTHFKSVQHNIQLVDGWDADIILTEQKIAILWNGVWHRKQLPMKNHSLAQVQNRDRLKIAALKQAGWKVIIFEDNEYTPETAFEFIKLFVNREPNPHPFKDNRF